MTSIRFNLRFRLWDWGLKYSLLMTGAAGLLLVSGCQSNPGPEYSKKIDFKHYRTFALSVWLVEGRVSDPTAVSRLIQPARAAVSDALKKKGFAETREEIADLLLSLQGQFKPNGPAVADKPLEESRALTIKIMDGRTREVVWSRRRTTVSAEPPNSERLRAIIVDMLRPFPPG